MDVERCGREVAGWRNDKQIKEAGGDISGE